MTYSSSLRNIMLATMISTGVATAVPVTVSNGSSATINFNGFYESSQIPIDGLSASITLDGFVFANEAASNWTKVTFNYSVTNTSTAPVTASRISAFGFDTSPNLLAGAPHDATGTYNSITASNQPNGLPSVEACVTNLSCTGGGSGGVTIGNTGSGTGVLYFALNTSQFVIDAAYVRYQSVACSSGAANCSSSASGIPVGDVPEPATYLFTSAGAAFLWLGRRKIGG
ncbi:MAG: PEP-CTERM sorting domain-containing protein [Acidobacteria bacterium]|nr:PEP-CTERM sorting domain-containing protein [Acidobacteriota bacterium]